MAGHDYTEVLNLVETLHKSLDTNITLIEINDGIDQLKGTLNKVNLDLQASLREKIELYFQILDPLNLILNKFQLKFHKHTELRLFQRTFLQIRIMCIFLIWIIVNNSMNYEAFKPQIHANLLSNVLQISNFKVSIKIDDIQDRDTFEDFALMYNYHQSSAGLYTAALQILDKFHVEDAIIWVNQAFSHYTHLVNLMEKINFEEIARIIEKGSHRDLPSLAVIFAWPLLEFSKFISLIFRTFGEEWLNEEIEYFKDTQSVVKSELRNLIRVKLDLIIQEFKSIDFEDKNYLRSQREKLRFISRIIREYHREAVVIEEEITIDEQILSDHLKFVKFLDDLQYDDRGDSMVQYYLYDAKITTLKYLSISEVNTSHKLSIIEDLLNIDRPSELLYPEFALIYIITKYNTLKTQKLDLCCLQKNIHTLQALSSKLRVTNSDQVMFDIVCELILFTEGFEDKAGTEKRLNDLRKDLEGIHVGKIFVPYLNYLIEHIQGSQTSVPHFSFKINRWDWRTWLVPLFDDDIVYIPLHSRQFVLMSEI